MPWPKPAPILPYAQAFLSRPAARQHRWAAACAALAVFGLTAVAFFVASAPMANLPAFLPMTLVILILSYGFTSLLLGLQANQLRHPTLAMLAGAYSFMAGVHLIQLLTFPGAFSESGLFGAGPQSAAWLGVASHIGFPIWVIIGIYQLHRKRSRFTLMSAWLVPTLAAIGVALLLVVWDDLPALVVNNRYSSWITSILAPFQTVLYAVTLGILIWVSRLRTLLHLWLAVVLLAMLAEVALAAYAGGRYTVGWYVARFFNAASSTVLLSALLWDIHDLYSRLQRINAALHEDSIKDGLTGLFQRRYFDQFLAKAAQEHPQEKLAIVLLDIDRFKLYNDSFGHPMGDACLTAVSQAVAQCVRSQDGFVARYGGEELVVALFPGSADRVAIIAEQIRKNVEALNLQHAPEAQQSWVTVSGGWATPGANWTAHTLLTQADTALYAAKHQGRNRIVSAEALNDQLRSSPS